MSFSRLAAPLLERDQLVDGRDALRAAPRRAVGEALSSTSTSVANGQRRALARDRVEAAQQQLALLRC